MSPDADDVWNSVPERLKFSFSSSPSWANLFFPPEFFILHLLL